MMKCSIVKLDIYFNNLCFDLDIYGNYRGERSLCGLLSLVQPPQEIDIIGNRMVSRSWRNYEEEEYLWEDMSPRLENHGRGSDNSRKDVFFLVTQRSGQA